MFKDYYSILGISYPSSDDEIRRAHQSKIKNLGDDSSKESNLNYNHRVDIEEAFRVLGTSYSLKTAYDEEYQYFMTEKINEYEIKDDWLLTRIKQERDFVINKILNPNHKIPKLSTQEKKSWKMKSLGCLGKIFIVYVCIITPVFVKKCLQNREKESNENTSVLFPTEEISSISILAESADSQLNYFVREKNATLPQDMDENTTFQSVLLENDAFIYVYKVDDDFFSEFKSHALSKDIQINNLRIVYHEMKPMIDLLKETHRGIYYRYICRESGEITECKIYYSDLLDLE